MQFHLRLHSHVQKHKHVYLGFGAAASLFFIVKCCILLFGLISAISSLQVSLADDVLLSGSVLSGDIASSGSVVSGALASGDVVLTTGTILSGSVLSGDIASSGSVVVSGSTTTGSVLTGSTVTGTIATGTTISGSVLQTVSQVVVQDRTAPVLSGVSFSVVGASGSVVGITTYGELRFDTSEALTNVRSSCAGVTGVLFQTSGLSYVYRFPFSPVSLSGALGYTLSFADLAGNTGSLTGSSFYTLDTTIPTVTGLSLTGTWTGLHVVWTSSKASSAVLSFVVHGFSFPSSIAGSGITTTGDILLTGITRGAVYDVDLVLQDIVGNKGKTSLILAINGSGVIKYAFVSSNLIYDVVSQNYVQVQSGSILTGSTVFSESVLSGLVQTTTGTQLLVSSLREDLLRFNECKSSLSFHATDITLGTGVLHLQMPNYTKTNVKNLVAAFTLVFLKKLEAGPTLSSAMLDEISKHLNNFFVVIKLLKDDDNSCKQNLSLHYLRQFKAVLVQYDISW